MDNYLSNLFSHWSSLKQLEAHYSEERLRTEQAIQEYLKDNNLWKDTGTMTFGDVKVRTQYRRKWNQEKLNQVKAEYDLGSMQFPFAIEYKEVKSQSDYLAEKEPETWSLIAPALIEYPTKPYFFIPKKGDKHGAA